MPWTWEDAEKHKKGLSEKKAKQWARIANSVLASCMKKGGTEKECAASAIRQASGVVGNNSSHYAIYKNIQEADYEVEIKVHQDKPYLIAPVVMMVEGVLNGSHGPLLHLAEEFGKFPESWNGIPIVIDHPEKDGVNVSANSPDIIDSRAVGKIYNTNMKGKSLKAEVWLDEDKLNEISPKTLKDINNNKLLEVSVGVFTEDEEVEGDWNGIHYNRIARNHRPDHLAILTECEGACSIEDGCGLGANENNIDMEIKGFITGEKLLQTIKSFNKEGYRLSSIGNNKEEGYKERLDAAYNAISMLSTSESYYLEELYDDELIYCVYNKEGSKMYKQGYKFESGKIELVGSPVEVHREVAFVVNSNNNLTKEDKKMSDNKCPKCLEKINALITNKESGFVEADREWLDTLTESALDKIAPKVIEKEKIVEKTVEVNKLTPEQEADLAFVKKQRADKRSEMTQGIQANTSKELWPDDVLKEMSEDHLKRIFDSVKKETQQVSDYSLMGGGMNANASDVEPLYPTGVEVETKAK